MQTLTKQIDDNLVIETVKKKVSRLGCKQPATLWAEFVQQGNFTICCLCLELNNEEKIGLGVSKRSVHDNPDPEIGMRIACSRACENAFSS